uniref:Uncharacterized protein n=1 Tax=Clastoptera arizonana TaxID=38151 RepID=A0A1B6E3R7_9HEMI
MVNSLEDDWKGDLPQFPGTAAFLDIKKEIVEEEEQKISDDEWQNDNVTSPGTVPPLSQAFLNLCGYGSTDEDDEIPTKKIRENNFNQEHKTDEVVQKCSLSENTVNENIKLSNTHSELDLDTGPEEAPIQHEDEQHDYNGKVNKIDEKIHNNHRSKENAPEKMPENVVQNKIEKVVKRNVPYNTRFTQRRRRHTLLEKLLKKEITHERNVILQCIRFVVQNNFLHEK